MQILRVTKSLMPIATVLVAVAGCAREPVEEPVDDFGTAKRLRVVNVTDIRIPIGFALETPSPAETIQVSSCKPL